MCASMREVERSFALTGRSSCSLSSAVELYTPYPGHGGHGRRPLMATGAPVVPLHQRPSVVMSVVGWILLLSIITFGATRVGPCMVLGHIGHSTQA